LSWIEDNSRNEATAAAGIGVVPGLGLA
jgi:hypothetical protein